MNFFRQKSIFTVAEQQKIVQTVQEAEQQTSGEIRIYIERHCKYMDALDWAAEVFYKLRMNETAQHNAVLIYLAVKDKQVAIYGDEGIHKIMGLDFWNKEVQLMIMLFSQNKIVVGLCECIKQVGEVLKEKFPYQGVVDKNELPDDIVFGK